MPTDAFEVQIADAVVAELNDPGQPWAGAFGAVRNWVKVYKMGPAATDLATLKCSVVPLTISEEEKLARDSKEKMVYTVAIDFQQKIDPTAGNAPIDALTLIAQQVHDFFRQGHYLATMPSAFVLMASRDSIFDEGLLYASKIWETTIALDVLIYR